MRSGERSRQQSRLAGEAARALGAARDACDKEKELRAAAEAERDEAKRELQAEADEHRRSAEVLQMELEHVAELMRIKPRTASGGDLPAQVPGVPGLALAKRVE